MMGFARSYVSQDITFVLKDSRTIVIIGASKSPSTGYMYSDTPIAKVDFDEIKETHRNVKFFRENLIVWIDAARSVSESEISEIKEKMKKDKQLEKESFGQKEK